jgi:hypothetical protein
MLQKVLNLFAYWNHVGGGILLKLFGGWLFCVSFDAFGGRGMHNFLRIRNARWMG